MVAGPIGPVEFYRSMVLYRSGHQLVVAAGRVEEALGGYLALHGMWPRRHVLVPWM